MVIENATQADFKYIIQKLNKYNSQKIDLKPHEFFEEILKCIKNSEHEVVGGISGDIELKCALHIKLFWISEAYRGKGLGKKLLENIELEGMKKGAKISYLETFGFQAREFYMKNGYEVFSQLNYPDGNVIYFMKRQL